MSEIAFEVFKGIVSVYDFVTLPIYAVVQRPWKVRAKQRAPRARQVDPNDPYSPWVRNGTAPTCLADECETIDQVMRLACQKYGNKRCMGVRRVLSENTEVQPDGKVFTKKMLADDYEWQTFAQINQRIDNISFGLLSAGVKPYDKVVIFMETRCEWMLAAQGLFRIGATLATLYATLGDEGIVHVINEIEATHIITSSDLIPKLAKLRSKLPQLKKIIYVDAAIDSKKPTRVEPIEGIEIMQFDTLESDGAMNTDQIRVAPKPDDIALIMYTSGSTGAPKGVMAWHRNFIAAIKSLNTILSQITHVIEDTDCYIGYLPLAHNLEFTTEHLLLSMGIPVGYSSPFTLTEKSPAVGAGCAGDAQILKPGAIVGVPMILDRIRKGINEQTSQKPPLVQKIFNFSIAYKNRWRTRGYDTPIINRLICRKIKASLGGRVLYMFCGGAPLSPDTQQFAQGCLDVTLMQGFGATETTAITSLMDTQDITTGRTGAPLFGCKVRLIDWDEGGYHPTDKPRPRGEIVVGGDFITAGYYKLDEQTAEVFREENGQRWFYTGDIGEMYPDGTLKIIDRKKDLLKLQHGEYVSLGKVEAEIKSCSFVENICVYGDSFKDHIVALIVPSQPATRALAKKLGIDSEANWETICHNITLEQEATLIVKEHCKKAGFHKSEIPAAIKLIADDWTPDSGLVTAALKIRRKPIQDRYRSKLDELYEKLSDNNNIHAMADYNANVTSNKKG